MFTVRVEPGNGRFTRDVYGCARYSVAGDDPSRLTLVLVDKDGGQETSIVLEHGAVAYVMNVDGVTVDIIRTKVEARAKAGG